MRRTLLSALVLTLLLAATTALAADMIVFGAAISITGKTAKEGEYTRDGYQFAIDKINELGGIKVGGNTYKVALKY
jgi:branched-chain amino acid transport system substrate-binding protein